MHQAFQFHDKLAQKYQKKKKISICFIGRCYRQARKEIVEFLSSFDVTLINQHITSAQVQRMNYVSALAKSMNKDANWEKSQTSKLIDEFVALRAEFNDKFDFLQIFDINLCRSLLNGTPLPSNTFFDVFNLECFARTCKQIPGCIYLTLDGPEYNNYIAASCDPVLKPSKVFYPHK